jgi:hypothetical protein
MEMGNMSGKETAVFLVFLCVYVWNYILAIYWMKNKIWNIRGCPCYKNPAVYCVCGNEIINIFLKIWAKRQRKYNFR